MDKDVEDGAQHAKAPHTDVLPLSQDQGDCCRPLILSADEAVKGQLVHPGVHLLESEMQIQFVNNC